MQRFGSAARWHTVCDPELLPHLMARFGGTSTPLAPLALGTGLCIACLALAGPSLPAKEQPLFRSMSARIIVLDLSRSMNAADLTPNRLERARYKVADILRRTGDGQAGMVVFAGEAFVISPLTDDSNTLQAFLPSLRPDLLPVPGSHLSGALALAAKLIDGAGLPGSAAEILVVADAVDSGSIAQAAALLERGIRTSVLGVGTVQGAPIPSDQHGFLSDSSGRMVVARLDEDALRAVASAGGGRYARIRPDDADLDELLTDSIAVDAERKASHRRTLRLQDFGYWLVAALLPFRCLELPARLVGLPGVISANPGAGASFRVADVMATGRPAQCTLDAARRI